MEHLRECDDDHYWDSYDDACNKECEGHTGID